MLLLPFGTADPLTYTTLILMVFIPFESPQKSTDDEHR